MLEWAMFSELCTHLQAGRKQDGGNHIPDIQCSESQGSNSVMLVQ